jgi:4-amino-4-deoxy-L-arabinose transferase-like glycosyltransferase
MNSLFLKKNLNILVIIFCVAAFTRVGMDIFREKVMFKKPFIYSGEALYTSLMNDEDWYVRTAVSQNEGNGVGSMNFAFYPPLLSRPDMSLRPIQGMYYFHNFVPPLYPLFLSLLFFLFGFNTYAYFIPHVILGSLTCVIIYLLSNDIFGNKVALLSALAVALYPDLVFWTYSIRTETLFIFLLVFSFWMLLKAKDSWPAAAAGAITWGLACLTRNTLTPFIPFLFLWGIVFLGENYWRNLIKSLLIIAIISMTLLPWAIRNHRIFGNFTPMSNEGSSSLVFERNITTIDTHRPIYRVLIDVVRYDPKAFVLSSARQFAYFWGFYGSVSKPFAKVYKTITWIVIFPLAFWGILHLGEQFSKTSLILLFIFYHSMIHSLSIVDMGLVYRYPVQPFLCIFFAYGFYDAAVRLKLLRKNTDAA